MDAPQVWLCLGTAGEGWQGENCELKRGGGGGGGRWRDSSDIFK